MKAMNSQEQILQAALETTLVVFLFDYGRVNSMLNSPRNVWEVTRVFVPAQSIPYEDNLTDLADGIRPKMALVTYKFARWLANGKVSVWGQASAVLRASHCEAVQDLF